jgi:hypothetical protein
MKIFFTSKVNKKQLRELICETAKRFGVKRTAFNRKAKNVRGTYNPFTGVLYLSLNQTKKELLNVFFHELGHHFAVKNNRWKVYHFNLAPLMTIERVFKIENRIDQNAKKLWNKYVDLNQWGKYNFAYPKSKKKQIMNHIANTL